MVRAAVAPEATRRVYYQIIGFLKRAEQEDYYDLGTDFNPFKIDT